MIVAFAAKMKTDKFHGKLSGAILLVQCSLCHYIVVHFLSYKFLDKQKKRGKIN